MREPTVMPKDRPKQQKPGPAKKAKAKQARKEKREGRLRRREAREVQAKVEDGRALAADVSKQKLDLIGSNARAFYEDYPFQCVDCGRHETWTAAAQKWWYEEAGGPIESVAIRCRACRKRHRHEKEEQRRRAEANRQKELPNRE